MAFLSTAGTSRVCWLDEPDAMLHVDMQSVNKWFGDLHVLRDITLGVERGERIVICGPSGSG